MEFRIWVETRLAGQTLERHNIATVERTEYPFAPEEIGLSLEQGKSILRQAQLRMVQTQADILGAVDRACVLCKRNHLVKCRTALKSDLPHFRCNSVS
jgi:hypothetical protein